MNKDVIKLIQQGYSILTPTMRMSRYLKNIYAAEQINMGNIVWESADILPWHTWLRRYWDESTAYTDNIPYCLNRGQQQSIWLRLVQNSEFSDQLLQPQSVALRALQAWELSHQWQITLFPEDIYINHDVRAFQSWAHAYQTLCQRENWIDNARLADDLIARMSKNVFLSLPKIALVGHDDILPQQLALHNAIRAKGGEVVILTLQNKSEEVSARGFIDTRDEINAAANWAAQLLKSDRDVSIGIVVPELEKTRTQLEDQFDDVFSAEDILLSTEPVNKPYSISLGQSLISYPIINSAFSILGLREGLLSLPDIASLLRSPYLGFAAEEKSKRAILDATLREFGEPHVSLKSLIFIARNLLKENQQCSSFLTSVDAWQLIADNLPRSQSSREWVTTFSSLLSVFDWPGARSLNSTEYQTMAAWQDLLIQFVSLDIVNSKLSFASALSQLRQLALGFSFQPETSEVPIEIMGHAGAAGMHFDHLWVLGLHEEAWPEAMDANPFVPLELQKQHNLPAASADNQLAYARNITERLLQSSADVVVSYPQNDKDRSLRPSPLVRKYSQTSNYDLIERLPSYQTLVFESQNIEYLDDFAAPAISPGQQVRGGTGLFKDQAACAFRAFAKHRLRSYPLSVPDIGLNAMERGSLLHDVMQLFWQRTASQTALLGMSPAEEESCIDISIDTVLAAYKKRRPQTFAERFIVLEKQRLKVVLQEWLRVEKKRENFRVLATEKEHNFELADIEVRTRIDRIDETEDGRRVIIDYKTGPASISAWFGERPDDPQLPLYATTSKGDIAALVFARIKRGESKFVGIAFGDDIVPPVKSFLNTQYANEIDSWSDLMRQWKSILLELGNDFRNGKADVDPKNVMTCRYCDQQPLCRIYELSRHTSQQLADEETNYE
jgi:ATP-dependent helicase/nuclease subunit B